MLLVHALEPAVKQHSRYPDAKSGDAQAAIALVHGTLNLNQVSALGAMLSGETPTLVRTDSKALIWNALKTPITKPAHSQH